jgi:hypothetical protein
VKRADCDRRRQKEEKAWNSGKAVSMLDMKIKDPSMLDIKKMDLNQTTSSMLDVKKPTSSLLSIHRKSRSNIFQSSNKTKVRYTV